MAGRTASPKGRGGAFGHGLVCAIAMNCTGFAAEAQASASPSHRETLGCTIRTANPAQDLVLLAASASSGAGIDQRRAQLERCLEIDEIIAATIDTTPRLSELWSQYSATLERLRTVAGADLKVALDEDAAWFRVRLRWDIEVDRSNRRIGADDIRELSRLVEARLLWLARVNPARQGLEGVWQNVFGEVVVSGRSGGIQLEATLGDPVDLGWTCEATIWLSSGADDDRALEHLPLTIDVEPGVLTIVQDPDPLSCGAHASLSGVYIAVDPQSPEEP